MKFWNIVSVALTAGALTVGGGAAHATMGPDVWVSGSTDGVAAPGGTAFTSFTIAFAGNYEFIGLGMTMTYDPALLSLNLGQSSVSVLGQPYSMPAFLAQLAMMQAAPATGFEVYAGETSPGDLFFEAGYTSPAGSTTLSGEIVVTTAFDLAPSFAVGNQSTVKIRYLEFADVNLVFSRLASTELPVEMTVSAVPEPESWLMLLAGMGLLGAVARRRVARA